MSTKIDRDQVASATRILRQFAEENHEGLSIVGAYGVCLDRIEDYQRREQIAKDANDQMRAELESRTELLRECYERLVYRESCGGLPFDVQRKVAKVLAAK